MESSDLKHAVHERTKATHRRVNTQLPMTILDFHHRVSNQWSDVQRFHHSSVGSLPSVPLPLLLSVLYIPHNHYVLVKVCEACCVSSQLVLKNYSMTVLSVRLENTASHRKGCTAIPGRSRRRQWRRRRARWKA